MAAIASPELLPGDGAPVLNGIVMRSGSSFSQDRLNEVIVGEKFATARGIRPGDHLHVVMNERREELIVVGTAGATLRPKGSGF